MTKMATASTELMFWWETKKKKSKEVSKIVLPNLFRLE